MNPTRYLASLALLAGLFGAPDLRAQQEVAGMIMEPPTRTERPDAYGTTSLTMVQVAATRCAPILGTTMSAAAEGYVQPTGGPGYFDCPLNLPAGSRPIKVDVVAHDTGDGTASVFALFGLCPVQAPGFQCYGHGSAETTGTSAAPFDGKITINVAPYNDVIDKTANLYFVRVVLNTVGGSVRFRQIDAYYRLQVSTPAPGTQTFADVPPTNPYYKGIEALAASGITGGCGNGNFCPSQNVTRGEIAVFFARALGLNFPN